MWQLGARILQLAIWQADSTIFLCGSSEITNMTIIRAIIYWVLITCQRFLWPFMKFSEQLNEGALLSPFCTNRRSKWPAQSIVAKKTPFQPRPLLLTQVALDPRAWTGAQVSLAGEWRGHESCRRYLTSLHQSPLVGLRAFFFFLDKELRLPLQKLNSCTVEKGIHGRVFCSWAENSISLNYPKQAQKNHKNVPSCSKSILPAFSSVL